MASFRHLPSGPNRARLEQQYRDLLTDLQRFRVSKSAAVSRRTASMNSSGSLQHQQIESQGEKPLPLPPEDGCFRPKQDPGETRVGDSGSDRLASWPLPPDELTNVSCTAASESASRNYVFCSAELYRLSTHAVLIFGGGQRQQAEDDEARRTCLSCTSPTSRQRPPGRKK